MSLDSLLATLESDVSPVADVQSNSGAAFRCNGTDTADVADVSTQRRDANPATSATAGNGADVSRKPASILACTPATAATAEIANARSEARKPWTGDLDPAAEDRRRRVLAMLNKQPGTRYAVVVNNPDTDPVLINVGIRDVATFELAIPAERFDAFKLLDLIGRHDGGTAH